MSLTEFCSGSATFHRIRRKRNIRSRTDPGFPTPGARIMVVYTNSLKLFIITGAAISLAVFGHLIGPAL